MDLKNKVAIITGARRGMGKADAILLAQEGAKVVVSDISLEDCQKVVDEIKKNGGEAMALQCDVSKQKEVEKMVAETIKKFGRIDILVNNAGILQFKPFVDISEEDWDKIMNINLKGYFNCAKIAAKEMIKQKSGVIVNIASIVMGQVGIGMPNIVHYCASKGGIVAMTQALAIELAPYNIRVNAIAPGAIDTPMAQLDCLDEKAKTENLSQIPLKRFGCPEDIANAVLFLASEKSSYITGTVLVVDGGYIAG
jgi:NAD(P)-dependent dehydrogenase (short-subunit alcohol dehydrogenase family)